MARLRQLLLMRHAKSSWDNPAADFDRPLSPRGQRDAPRIGAEIAKHGWLPDMALVSPAARTRETWRMASASWPAPLPPASFPKNLYEASVDALLAQVQSTPNDVGVLLVIGHNPSLEAFARQLSGPDSDAKTLSLLLEKFPTAALARFKFDGRWNELHFDGARITHFIRPRDLD